MKSAIVGNSELMSLKGESSNWANIFCKTVNGN